jgi:hypothetical protein
MHSVVLFFQSASNALRGFATTQTPTSLGVHSFILSLFCHLLWKLYVRRRDNPRGLPYPPGPKRLPLIGNLFDFARENESAAYLGMAHKYGGYILQNVVKGRMSLRRFCPTGDLVFLSALGINVLIVNDFQTANELFEKRSANYSDRHESPMINHL